MASQFSAAELIQVDDWHPLDDVPAPEYIPPAWDGPHVGKRLIEAFETLARLPWSWGPAQYGSAWPAYLHDVFDLNAQEGADTDQKDRARAERNRVRTLPSANDITRMEVAIGWAARYLVAADQAAGRDRRNGLARCVQFVAYWRSGDREMEWIAPRLRVHPTTARRRNRDGLDLIAAGLRRDGAKVF